MNDNEWLHSVLNMMREDIIEIKQDLKGLKEFKFRLLGGVFALSSLITIAINLIAIWVRW